MGAGNNRRGTRGLEAEVPLGSQTARPFSIAVNIHCIVPAAALDGKINIFMARWLPDRARDWVILKAIRFFGRE